MYNVTSVIMVSEVPRGVMAIEITTNNGIIGKKIKYITDKIRRRVGRGRNINRPKFERMLGVCKSFNAY